MQKTNQLVSYGQLLAASRTNKRDLLIKQTNKLEKAATVIDACNTKR
jgi:hypothetical protein